MAFVDSRLGPGTLTLGATPKDFSAQISNLVLTPAVTSTDGTPTLATPDPAPQTATDYTLDGSGIADFSDAQGLNRYLYDNDGITVPFHWTPQTSDTTALTGSVVARAMPIGGAPGGQIITDFSLPCVGKPVWADTMTAREGKAAK